MNFKKNTGKAPSIQLYYKDLLADIQEHGNEFVGAWIKILCHIWHDSKDGSITKTIAQFSRIIGENEADTLRIISYFSEENIATVTHANGKITVINRRVQKDLKLKEQNRLRQRKFKAKRENNGEVTTILPNPSSSSSSSFHLLLTILLVIIMSFLTMQESNIREQKED